MHGNSTDDAAPLSQSPSCACAAAVVCCCCCRTMGYMAPEVLRRSYTEAADVWSTGVMLYEMVSGQLPFNLGNTCEEVSSHAMPGACAVPATLSALQQDTLLK